MKTKPDSLDLEQQIRDALSVEPSREFLARVRQRIAEEPRPSTMPRVLWSAGALAAAVVLALSISLRNGEGDRREDELAPTARAEGIPMPLTAAMPIVADVPMESPRNPRRVRLATQEAAVPEVLISPDQSEAIRQLIADASQRRFEVSLEDVIDTTDVHALSDIAITIPPIVIEPLPDDKGVIQ